MIMEVWTSTRVAFGCFGQWKEKDVTGAHKKLRD